MVINISLYEMSKPHVIAYYRAKGIGDASNAISMCATSFLIPAIAVAYWVGEESGWPQEIVDKIQKITEFYGYTEVIGKPKGAPL